MLVHILSRRDELNLNSQLWSRLTSKFPYAFQTYKSFVLLSLYNIQGAKWSCTLCNANNNYIQTTANRSFCYSQHQWWAGIAKGYNRRYPRLPKSLHQRCLNISSTTLELLMVSITVTPESLMVNISAALDSLTAHINTTPDSLIANHSFTLDLQLQLSLAPHKDC